MSDRLLLVRHGVTDWNREGRFQGHMDPPLADDGRLEAALVAGRLAGDPKLRPARIVASPLARSVETAEALLDALRSVIDDPPALSTDARLMEIGQGKWEGLTHDELAVRDAERYAAWRAHAGEQQPPGAETIEDAAVRVGEALDELLAGDRWPLCIVSHGGTLRLAARHLLGIAPLRAWALDLDNASISLLERIRDGSGWRVVRWNDTAHLLGRASLHVDEAEGEPLAL